MAIQIAIPLRQRRLRRRVFAVRAPGALGSMCLDLSEATSAGFASWRGPNCGVRADSMSSR